MVATLDLRGKRNQPWRVDDLSARFTPYKVVYGADPTGPGGLGFQVAVALVDPGASIPTLGELRALHRKRQAGVMPLLVAVTDGTRVWTLGPSIEQTGEPMPLEQAQRQLQSVLDEPDAQAAFNRLVSLSRAASTTLISGVTNSGLFASYHLRENAPNRADWPQAGARSRTILGKRGLDLVKALGFTSERGVGGTLILSGSHGPARSVAVLLDEAEHFEATSSRFQLSPAAFGLRVAADLEVPWLMVLRKDQVRLYPGKDGVGVGQKGQTETFFEIDLAALDPDYLALLPLVFSVEALTPGGTAGQLMEDSARFATQLGARLRDRIYQDVVPPLAKAVAVALQKDGLILDADGLAIAYRVTLRILFRLLFQAYAEDRGLLPAGRNSHYDEHSLKHAARRDIDADQSEFSAGGCQLWIDLVNVWNAIDQGNARWQVPAYNGGLFASDPSKSPEGKLIVDIQLPDAVVGPVMQHLLVDDSGDGQRGPVDFRSLSVREFGTIYEGLLESSLSVADQDLTVDRNGAWVFAKPGDPLDAPAGAVYFHSASGERKASGSYYTPKVVVDHLIERSITPILEAHLAKVADLLVDGEAVKAERLFFDFRVADLAMGSAHFLVAAVDKVEALMRNFLTQHPMPSVQTELLRLAEVAKAALGDDEVAKAQIDEPALLRRQIARRCIYGLDINPMSVELARLAMWIHTFVPGLPMSNLDHNLVCANSLTGIGSVEEALDAIVEAGREKKPNPRAEFQWRSFLKARMDDALKEALPALQDMANAQEATKAEVAKASELLHQARERALPARRMFDVAMAARMGAVSVRAEAGSFTSFSDLIERWASGQAVEDLAATLRPAHMPYLFPEVFLRTNPGFDVLLGNPPWEKLQVVDQQWWGLRIPGLRSMPMAKRTTVLRDFQKSRPDLAAQYEAEVAAVSMQNRAVAAGHLPGIGAAHLDLSSAFAWRNWHLVRSEGGRIALVLPRTSLSGSSLAEWRRTVLAEGSFEGVCFIYNANGWIFPGVHSQFTTIGLTVIARGGGDHRVRFAGPFFSAREFADGEAGLAEFEGDEFASWSSTASFPMIPNRASSEVFQKMKRSPRFDSAHDGWEFRAIQGDLNQTLDKSILQLDVDTPNGRTPVLAGASFNLWNPDFGPPYAYSDPHALRRMLLERFRRGTRSERSAYSGITHVDGSLPMDRARVAFRWMTNQTNTRTTIACLLPPGVAVNNKGPLLVRRQGSETHEAFILGVMSSLPFDWMSRRWVEMSFTFEILNTLPFPTYSQDSALCARVVEVAGRLAALDGRYSDWAEAVGVPVGSAIDQAVKDDLIFELDALVAVLYGLSDDQVEHVFATFHRGWNYVPRLAAVLTHYAKWKGQL